MDKGQEQLLPAAEGHALDPLLSETLDVSSEMDLIPELGHVRKLAGIQLSYSSALLRDSLTDHARSQVYP